MCRLRERLALLTLTVAVASVAACVPRSGSPEGSVARSVPATAVASAGPASIAPPPLTSPPTAASAAAETRAATRILPPAGSLATDGGAVDGYLGSYCFAGTCADLGAWPVKADLPLVAAATGSDGLTFTVSDEVRFYSWQATYAASDSDPVEELAEGGRPFDPDSRASPPPAFESVDITVPPAGDWSVFLFVRVASGDLTYAWHVVVD